MIELGHIGDGVYLSHDGYQFWLAANSHQNKVIALDPTVTVSLINKMCEVEPRLKAPIRTITQEQSDE